MIRSLKVALLLALAVLFTHIGVAQSFLDPNPQAVRQPEPQVQVEPTPEEPITPEEAAEEALALMDLRARVSQLMMVVLEGRHAPTVEDLGFLKRYVPGAVVIRQIYKPEAAAIFIQKVRGVEGTSGLPLLVGANMYALAKRDRDAPSAFVQLPSQLSVAAANDDSVTEKLGQIMANQMATMGFNFHLGPNLELAPELDGAEGSIYNFGSDPDFAGHAGRILSEQFLAAGIMPMLTGFPGGGANRIGKDPAVLLTPRSLLSQQDLLPYIDALSADVNMVHVGTTLVPLLEQDNRPACLSAVVMRDILRTELAFDGLVIAGPMDHPDVTARYDSINASLEALRNGADMLFLQSPPNQVMRVVDRIVAIVEAGEFPEEIINNAFQRVLSMKIEQIKLRRAAGEEKKMRQLKNQKELVANVLAVERQAITVVQNHNNILPLTEDNAMPLALTGVVGVEDLRATMEKFVKRVSMQRITTAGYAGRIQDFEIDRLVKHSNGIKTVVITLTADLELAGQLQLVRAFKERGTRVVLILLGYPAHLDALSEADAIVLAYPDKATYELTMQAIGETIMGEGQIAVLHTAHDAHMKVGEERDFDIRDVVRVPAGRLPVTVSEHFEAGLAIAYDPTELIKRAEWDFGTGKTVKDFQTRHAFTAPGRYPVTLTVTDKRKNTVSGTFYVTVTEP